MSKSSFAALGATVVAVCVGCAGRASDSTLRQTYVDRTGHGVLSRGPGEAFVDRTALAPRSAAKRRLAVFVQLTDAHVMDEESFVHLRTRIWRLLREQQALNAH